MEVIAALYAEPGHDGDLAVTAALLHDVVEDTTTKLHAIEQAFGPRVVAGVSALSKDPSLDKRAAVLQRRDDSPPRSIDFTPRGRSTLRVNETSPEAAPADPAASAAPADPAAPATSAAADVPAKIDFDRAEFADAGDGEHVTCGACQRRITTEYWQLLGKILCDTCRDGVRRSADDARSGASFGKALLLGGGAALGLGIAYASFVGLAHLHLALVTIGIGWAIGTVMQRVTRGFGSRRHQVLAVALTYFASSMGYFPGVINALRGSGSSAQESTAKSGATPTAAPSQTPAAAASGTAAATESPSPGAPDGKVSVANHGLLFSIAVITVVSVVFTLAAPLLDIGSGFSGLLGLLIIFFGLRTAWQLSKGVEAVITGPHRVTPTTGS